MLPIATVIFAFGFGIVIAISCPLFGLIVFVGILYGGFALRKKLKKATKYKYADLSPEMKQNGFQCNRCENLFIPTWPQQWSSRSRDHEALSVASNINSGRLTLNALLGDYADAGDTVMAVNYTFDASGPSSRLIGLTIVNFTHSNAEFQKVLAARQAAAAAVIGPLRKASATEFQGAGSGCSLRLVPNDGSWFIYEIYELKR